MRWVWLVLGVLLVLSGIVWTLQGLDLLGQSGGMNGQKIWVVIGPITAVVGLLLVRLGLRRPAGQ
ncbi:MULTISPECIES: hypothetical protein [Catellatospora]|uniref:Uncharacterized protein n=1 Tax=Catellatospora coxensis TaxID=310354 RepID=A0A8J3KRF9_9ACTN|nr:MULTISPECIES: hypothetical protein [Catellatospora]GIG07298.1 hypothetical protein Cco03nite_39980 [Catellatospora coxensis]